MPFIDSKITLKVSEDKKKTIKERLGKAVNIIGKTESWLMVGFDDEYDLYFAGEKLEKGAYVSVSLFGEADQKLYDRMSAEICGILEEELGIPGDRIYITYHGLEDWGWNGANF